MVQLSLLHRAKTPARAACSRIRGRDMRARRLRAGASGLEYDLERRRRALDEIEGLGSGFERHPVGDQRARDLWVPGEQRSGRIHGTPRRVMPVVTRDQRLDAYRGPVVELTRKLVSQRHGYRTEPGEVDIGLSDADGAHVDANALALGPGSSTPLSVRRTPLKTAISSSTGSAATRVAGSRRREPSAAHPRSARAARSPRQARSTAPGALRVPTRCPDRNATPNRS